MASITSLSLRRPVATSMVYLILIVVGLVSFLHLPVDLLPVKALVEEFFLLVRRLHFYYFIFHVFQDIQARGILVDGELQQIFGIFLVQSLQVLDGLDVGFEVPDFPS